MPVDARVETFDELTGEGSVLVDFWGPRCQPCLAMMPTVARLEKEADGAVRVVKVNAPEAREICRELKVFGLPTYVLMRDGVEIDRLTGDVGRAELEQAFTSLRGGETA
jgi:thioredoxin 1